MVMTQQPSTECNSQQQFTRVQHDQYSDIGMRQQTEFYDEPVAYNKLHNCDSIMKSPDFQKLNILSDRLALIIL